MRRPARRPNIQPAVEPAPEISREHQNTLINSASRALKQARNAHAEATVRYAQTAPTAATFSDVVQELQAATQLLIAARDAFLTICATI